MAPLEKDWPGIDARHRQVWFDLASRHPAHSVADQACWEKINHLASLTAVERTPVRAQVKLYREMTAAQQQEMLQKWFEYVSLPEEVKQAYRNATIKKWTA